MTLTTTAPAEAPVSETAELPYVIVRTYSAGVFYAQVFTRDGREATLHNARRLYYWSGAATLSELSQRGVSHPSKCQFPMAVPSIIVTQIIEILSTTAEARASIEAVPIWTEHR